MSLIRQGGGVRLPYAGLVRRLEIDQPFIWVIGGWRDFFAAPAASLAYGAIFVVIGVGLTQALICTHMIYMLLPLISGFMLLGPVLAVGLHAMGREQENNLRPSLANALLAWRSNPGPILNAALAFLLLFLVWLRLSQLLFALTVPYAAGLDVHDLGRALLYTASGQTFVVLFVLLGAVMAVIAFACGAFTLQIMLDRDVGLAEAVSISVTAVWMNVEAMAYWAAILVVLVAAGFMLAYVGLAVTLPIAGRVLARLSRGNPAGASDVAVAAAAGRRERERPAAALPPVRHPTLSCGAFPLGGACPALNTVSLGAFLRCGASPG